MELFVHKLILAYNSKSAPGIISNSPAINFSDNFDLEKLKIRDGPLLVHLTKLPDMCVEYILNLPIQTFRYYDGEALKISDTFKAFTVPQVLRGFPITPTVSSEAVIIMPRDLET